jgi:hypothetical protein
VARFVKSALIGAAVAFLIAAVLKYGGQLAGRIEHVRVANLVAAAVLCLGYRVVNAYGWVFVLRALGHRMGAVEGVRIWLLSETFRWLPGSVWGIVSRVAQANAAGVPALAASLTPPIELVLTIVSWVLVAAAGLGFSGAAAMLASHLSVAWIVGGLALCLAVVGAALALIRLQPDGRLATKVRSLTASMVKLRAAGASLGWLGVTLVFFTVLGVVNGAGFLLVLAATSDVHPGLLASAGVNAAGWLLGFFAFFAPSGLGVREGGTTAMLAPLMPLDAAVAGGLLWRAVQVAVELVCLLACVAPRALAWLRPAPVPTEGCEKVV